MEKIGKITSIHGLKGEVTFSHELKLTTLFDTWDCLLIELNPKSYIPFFIEYIKPLSDNECVCKLEEIANREEAKQIVSKSIYSSPNYSIQTEYSFSYLQYINYELYDEEKPIGKIVDAVDQGKNKMFIVDFEGKEVLIPANDQLIKSVDDKQKKVIMELPEGLLDL